MQLLGKGQRASGERRFPATLISEEEEQSEWAYCAISEAFDGVQSLVTLITLLAEENGIDIQGEIDKHEKKLREKGYLVGNPEAIDPSWMVCENCGNQPSENEIPKKCEECEDNEWGRPSNFVRRR